MLDLPMREADVAIRMKEPSQADLIRQQLMSVRMRLYASPEYLDRAGRPATMADLSPHRLICQNTTSAQVSAGARLVQELMANDISSTLTVNNYFGVLQAVLANVGDRRPARLPDRGFPGPRARASGRGIGRGAGVPRLSRRAQTVEADRGIPGFRDRGGHRAPSETRRLIARFPGASPSTCADMQQAHNRIAPDLSIRA